MKTHGLHHVSFIVSDVEESLRFYHELLELPVCDTRPAMSFAGAWLEIGAQGQQIHLLQLPNPDPRDGRPEHGGRDRHAALQVDSFAPLLSKLQQRNIPYSMSSSGRRALFVRDPDGNALELIEAGA